MTAPYPEGPPPSLYYCISSHCVSGAAPPQISSRSYKHYRIDATITTRTQFCTDKLHQMVFSTSGIFYQLAWIQKSSRFITRHLSTLSHAVPGSAMLFHVIPGTSAFAHITPHRHNFVLVSPHYSAFPHVSRTSGPGRRNPALFSHRAGVGRWLGKDFAAAAQYYGVTEPQIFHLVTNVAGIGAFLPRTSAASAFILINRLKVMCPDCENTYIVIRR